MNNKPLILAALLGLAFTASPMAFADNGSHTMSDVQHRKTMGGLHHPEDGKKGMENREARPMSDVQHRKHMGGLHHPSEDDR